MTTIPLIAAGTLLAGCGAGPSAPDQSAAPTSAAASSPAAASDNCSELQNLFIKGDLPQAFYDGVDLGVQVIETTSGTVLQDGPLAPDAVEDPDTSAPATAYPNRMEPEAEWPRDSVVFIDAGSGEVMKTIDVPDDLKCAP